MTILSADDSLIVIIDVQEKLLDAVFNKEIVAKSSEIIAKTADAINIPVIVTEQYPKGLGVTIPSLKSSLNRNTKFFEKNTFSALDNSEIQDTIKLTGKKQIVILGIETHICVSQTAIALKNSGYDVHVITDACGSRREEEYNAGIRRMQDNGIYSITTEIALFEWLKTSKHPQFKVVQSLIK